MVLRLKSTIGNVVLFGGLLLVAVGAIGLQIEALTQREAIAIGGLALVLVGVGVRVRLTAGSD